MSGQGDVRIQELGNLRIALRDDLVFSPSLDAGRDGYTIEDPLTNKFYHVGLREYEFLSLLNGSLTIGKALQQAATAAPGKALTQREGALLCNWVIQTQLARPLDAPSSSKPPTSDKASSPWKKFNPLFLKVPFIDPDLALSRLSGPATWLFGRFAFFIWLVVLLSGLFQVGAHAERLREGAAGILAVHNWIWLGLSWCLLKVVHELSHGLVCKRYGGNVHEAGLLFILFTPVPYVDITSSWRFRSKWQRIHAAVAGMYAELFFASIAAWVFAYTSNDIARHLAFNVMVMASITTLAFNANPLMRFDGYYVLADWLEIPNLSAQASQYWQGIARRIFLGLPGVAPKWAKRRLNFLRVYGAAVLVWRCFVMCSLVLAASVMFHGAGIVLSLVSVCLWLGGPIWKLVCELTRIGSAQPNWVRFSLTTSTLGTLVAIFFTFIPWIGPYRAPAVVEHSPLAVVRAGSSGFVRELRVTPGARVSAGDVLAVLENPQLLLELRKLELKMEVSRLKSRTLQLERKLAEQQAEQEQLASYAIQLSEKAAQVDNLVVRAPISGIVMGRQLETLLGTFLDLGDEIMTIGDDSRKELRISIAQHDAQMFESQVGKTMHIRLNSGEHLEGTFERLEPQASAIPPHSALGAHCGGPVPVTERRVRENNNERINYEFVNPRLVGLMPLDPSAAKHLFSGQVGSVSFRDGVETFGGHLVSVSHRWLRSKLDMLTRAQQ